MGAGSTWVCRWHGTTSFWWLKLCWMGVEVLLPDGIRQKKWKQVFSKKKSRSVYHCLCTKARKYHNVPQEGKIYFTGWKFLVPLCGPFHGRTNCPRVCAAFCFKFSIFFVQTNMGLSIIIIFVILYSVRFWSRALPCLCVCVCAWESIFVVCVYIFDIVRGRKKGPKLNRICTTYKMRAAQCHDQNFRRSCWSQKQIVWEVLANILCRVRGTVYTTPRKSSFHYSSKRRCDGYELYHTYGPELS